MINGIIYCRVSSKEQIEGTSLESQETACREYARSKGIQILQAFVEQGESAKFADRTQLLALIDYCRTHKGAVQKLLVWKVDRFARNVTDHFTVKATLGKYGVDIVSVTEPIDTNPEGKLMETILAGFAQFDNDVRAMRTVQGMRRKLQEGIFPWGPPLGYKSPALKGEKKNVPDVPDEPAFSLLRTAWKAFATGSYTQTEMGRLIGSWGITNEIKRPMPHQTVYQLFTNAYYAGLLVDPWTGETYEGRHVQMVSREQFAQVQQVLRAKNRSIPHTKDRPEFPLRNFARCAACEQGVTGGFSRGHGGQYAYYLCQHHECAMRGKSHRVETVHSEFTSFLDQISPRPNIVRDIGERVITAAVKEEADRSAQVRKRRNRVGELERQIEELIRMRAQNLITNEEFLSGKSKLAEQRAALNEAPRGAIHVDQAREDIETLAAPLSALKNTWLILKPPFRRRFERIILPAGFVIGRIRTSELGPIFSIFGASGSPSACGVPLTCTLSNHIFEEIHAIVEILKGVPLPDPPPKRRFDNSHRNRLRMPKSNQ